MRSRRTAVEQSSLELVVKAGSLAVTDASQRQGPARNREQMKENVLEMDDTRRLCLPARSFREQSWRLGCTPENSALTLHGVTHPRRSRPRIHYRATTRCGPIGEFSLRQTDYSIKLVSVAGGALKVKDEVKFTFDMVAQQKANA